MPRALGDWLTSYLAYTSQSLAPERFHIWTGLSLLASAARRNVWIEWSYEMTYPNLYVLLAGPPGCGKTIAMGIGKKMLFQVPEVRFTPNSGSLKQVINEILGAYSETTGQSAVTVCSSEFATLINTSGMAMVEFLTDIFDCPSPQWVHKTEGAGERVLKNPCLNLLACATPEWIAKSMPIDLIGVGLTSRIVFCYQSKPRMLDHWNPKLDADTVTLGRMLAQDLAYIARHARGELRMTQEADELYNSWWREHQRSTGDGIDPRISGYYARKNLHALKLTQLLAVGRRDTGLIEPEDVTDSLSILSAVEQDMPRVFSGVGKNPLAQDLDAIFAYMIARAEEGVTLGELLSRFYFSVQKEELESILSSLTTIGSVRYDAGRYHAIPDEESPGHQQMPA